MGDKRTETYKYLCTFPSIDGKFVALTRAGENAEENFSTENDFSVECRLPFRSFRGGIFHTLLGNSLVNLTDFLLVSIGLFNFLSRRRFVRFGYIDSILV